jgi:hypothetical protein
MDTWAKTPLSKGTLLPWEQYSIVGQHIKKKEKAL